MSDPTIRQPRYLGPQGITADPFSSPTGDRLGRDPVIGKDAVRVERMRALEASQHIAVIAKHLYLFHAALAGRGFELCEWELESADVQSQFRLAALAAAAGEVEHWNTRAHEAGVDAAVKFDAENGERLAKSPLTRASYLCLMLLHYTTARATVLTDPEEFKNAAADQPPSEEV